MDGELISGSEGDLEVVEVPAVPDEPAHRERRAEFRILLPEGRHKELRREAAGRHGPDDLRPSDDLSGRGKEEDADGRIDPRHGTALHYRTVKHSQLPPLTGERISTVNGSNAR